MPNPIFLVTPMIEAVKKVRNNTTKLDLVEYKKLCKAFLIMMVQANKTISRKMAPEVAIECWVKGRHSDHAVKRRGIRTKYWVNDDDMYVPVRCLNVRAKIAEIYPRISEIKEADRLESLSVASVNEESIDWAESIARSHGINIEKDRLVTGEEVTVRKLRGGVRSQGIDAAAKFTKDALGKSRRVTKSRATVTIENIKVQEV